MAFLGLQPRAGARHTPARRIWVAGLVLAACAAWLPTSAHATAAATATGESRTDAFRPVADARVEEARPAANFGTLTRMGTDGDAGLRVESVLRFEVAGLAGQVQNARLRLYVTSDGSVDGPQVYPTGSDWTETAVTWETRPRPTGPAVAGLGPTPPGTWVELEVTQLVTGSGTFSFLLEQPGLDGAIFYAREGTYKPQLIVVSGDPVVMAAGDIACHASWAVTATKCRQGPVSDLLTGRPGLARVLALGDFQYEDGVFAEYFGAGAYDATWGRVKAITSPVPGNHDYHVAGAPGYFDYFNGIGAQFGPAGERGKGYYSFDLGSWHLIALNAGISTFAGSPQEKWLRSDLAATRQPCVLAYWHQPRFTSGDHGPAMWVAPLWNTLYAARTDVVLTAHDLLYERFGLQDPNGYADAKGIRQFVVGTGGASHGRMLALQPNSEVHDNTTFGVLELVLRGASYDWQFVPEAGGTFTDQGSGRCNDDPPAASLSVTPATGLAPLAVTADASGSTDADRTPIADYEFDFGDGSPSAGPQPGAVASHRYESPGTYTVTVTVTDTGGQVAKTTAKVVVHGNLIANPGFEAGTSGWNAQPVGPDTLLERVVGGHSGEMAARLVNSGALPRSCTLNDSPNWVTSTSQGTYTASMWVRGEVDGAMLKLRLAEWSGATLVGGAKAGVTLTTEWQPVTIDYTPAAPGSSTLDLSAYVLGAPRGTCFFADDAALSLSEPGP